MKSLQIAGDSPYGGAGYLLYKWCQFLLAQGWQVDILATHESWTPELKKVPGLRLIDDILIPRNIDLVKDASAIFQLGALMKREHYDVVHTYTATPGFVGRLTARLMGVPVILHHQAGWTVTEFTSLRNRLIYQPLEYLASVLSSKVICVSYAVEELGRKHHFAPLSKMEIICNGIDAQPFIDAVNRSAGRELREKLGLSEGHLIIGNTGRLSAQKDNQTLVKALPFLKKLIPDIPFTLLLAGDGSDRTDLQELIHGLDLNNQVRLLGFVKDIPSFLAAIDIFVSPSLWEGLSISIMEAMAAGRPIVTTTILPNAELIQHESTGLLVPPRAPEQVAMAIARYVNAPALCHSCGAAARQRVLKYYTIDFMFQQTLDLYLKLLPHRQEEFHSSLTS